MKPSEQSQVNFIADCLLKSRQGNKSIPKRGFYVYAITENEEVCYLGKGKGQRVLSHFNRSTNQLLSQRIKENRNLYDWFIIEVFDSEYECLEYEEQLIKSAKQADYKLYNSTFYSNKNACHKSLKQVYEIFEQFRNRIFPINTPSEKIITALERARILLNICKSDYSDLKVKPIYRGKPLDELTAVQIDCVNYCRIIIA